MATVQGIVKSHEGFINVYSEVGGGTKFSVYLPAALEPRSTPIRKIGTFEESGRSRLILLVDDEAMILQMTSKVLEGSGYRVLTARDGATAVGLYAQHKDEIAVVCLDMMMPGMDGLQTLDHLLKINPQVKVIACSGLRTSQRETEVVANGAKAFLPKPYSDDQLLQLLSQILETNLR